MPFDHFGLIAGLYDRVGQFRLTKPFLELLSLSAGCLLLDAGGGTGRVAAALRNAAKNVIVADISRGMLIRAVSKGLATVCAPAESLPFPSESIDRIIMMDALHHVTDQRQTVRELWRVIIPGGRILIVEPDIHKPSVKLIAVIERMLFMRSHFLIGEEITSLFDDLNGKISLIFQDSSLFLVAEKVKPI